MNRHELLEDAEENLRGAIDAAQASMWTALPGLVVGVNLVAQTLSVQPAIQGSVSGPDGSVASVNLPMLVDVPIVWPRGGGFALTLPVAVGDEVLVVFSSRAIDSWWQQGGIGAPIEPRMHDLSDGFAILAPTSQIKKLPNCSAANVQLRDEAGTTYIEIAPGGKIKLLAAADIELVAPTIKLTGVVVQSGGTITSNGKNISNTHVHSGVTAGAANTGVPT